MLARKYFVENELGLYESILEDLSQKDFSSEITKMFCYLQNGSQWEIADELVTNSAKILARAFLEVRQKYFVIIITGKDYKITVNSTGIKFLGSFAEGVLTAGKFESESKKVIQSC